MRIYLVVIDESEEASVALRFAARRAVKTGGGVEILALIPPAEFVQWGGVQATIEEEARQKAEGLVKAAAGTLVAESGLRPSITVRQGEAGKVIRDMGILRLNVKNMGYDIARALSDSRMSEVPAAPPAVDLGWRASTQADIESDWVASNWSCTRRFQSRSRFARSAPPGWIGSSLPAALRS